MTDQERTVWLTFTLTPRRLETMRASQIALAEVPGLVARVTAQIGALNDAEGDNRGAVREHLAALAELARIAHGLSEAVWAEFKAATISENRGMVQ